MRRFTARTSLLFAAGTLLLGGLSLPAAQAAPAPTVTGFSPACGPVGTTVSIGGRHFQGATLVEFNGVDQTNITVNSSNLITTTVPSGATTGPIKVTTPSGSGESTDHYTVGSSCAPDVTGFTPTSGPVGTPVTISGSNFVGTTLVEFGGVDQTAFSWNPQGTQLTANVPTAAVDGPITVTTPLGTDASSQSFDVTGGAIPAPTITSFVPISGPVGTSVVITGTNLTGATEVKFKNTSATSFTVNSATQITAVVPTGATTGKISVTTPGGTASSAANFTVTAAGSPTITSFSPASGAVGTSVVITGTNFTGTTSVKFNGVTATFTINSSTQITATVPPFATTGPITVTNPNGTGTSATSFTVTGGPTITSFSPTSGTVGTAVTIVGTNFTGATQVKFGNTPATSFTVNPQGTQISTSVPSGAATGKISVTTPAGTATSATNFTVLAVVHARAVSLDLVRALVARGYVTVGDGFSACFRGVPVKIQRRVGGEWRTIDGTITDATGFYRERIPDRPGAYRAKAPKVVIGDDVCVRAFSSIERN